MSEGRNTSSKDKKKGDAPRLAHPLKVKSVGMIYFSMLSSSTVKMSMEKGLMVPLSCEP